MTARQIKVSGRTGTLGAFLILALSARTIADVPASVGVRLQSAPVEQIIGTLEAKAAKASGTWVLSCGRKDKPATSEQLAVDGPNWVLKSVDGQQPGASAWMLVGDGADDYFVPSNPSSDLGMHFQFDTLIQGQFPGGREYSLGALLLQINLMPRQFIASLGNLSIGESETVNGRQLVHLHYQPQGDEVNLTDPAFVGPTGLIPSAPERAVVDLYYDSEYRAITHLTLMGLPNGPISVEVQAWENFGTSEHWPSKLASTTPSSLRLRVPAEEPYLTSVEKFAPGEAAEALDAAHREIVHEEFFYTPPNSLRSLNYYRHPHNGKSTINDEVALAEADFISAQDVGEGLHLWQQTDGQLQQQESRIRLAKVLGPMAAAAADMASKDPRQRTAAAAILGQLASLPDDASFRPVAIGACSAWQRLRNHPDTK